MRRDITWSNNRGIVAAGREWLISTSTVRAIVLYCVFWRSLDNTAVRHNYVCGAETCSFFFIFIPSIIRPLNVTASCVRGPKVDTILGTRVRELPSIMRPLNVVRGPKLDTILGTRVWELVALRKGSGVPVDLRNTDIQNIQSKHIDDSEFADRC